jgi:hypothetical protein
MTGPASGEPSERPGREDPDLSQFALAEKLAAEWEARHFAAARRTGGLGVQQYLSHERCTDACSSAGHPDRHREAASARRRQEHPAPVDSKPHLSDLWGWLGGPASGHRDDRPR